MMHDLAVRSNGRKKLEYHRISDSNVLNKSKKILQNKKYMLTNVKFFVIMHL